ncbi:MAG: hypothetical protein M1511_15960 [Deltaproteobacteria bacterium]|nr:hypothetical protein [Deltaproteobacteria bacterium]
MSTDFSDDYFYGPRDCELEQEHGCIAESFPILQHDPVVKTFADILDDAAERAVGEYEFVPADLTVSIVLNFPNVGVKTALIYSLDEWNAHLLTEYASELAKAEVELPRPRYVRIN